MICHICHENYSNESGTLMHHLMNEHDITYDELRKIGKLYYDPTPCIICKKEHSNFGLLSWKSLPTCGEASCVYTHLQLQGKPSYDDLLETVLDLWCQFAYNREGALITGGLSALEGAEYELIRAHKIDINGLPLS